MKKCVYSYIGDGVLGLIKRLMNDIFVNNIPRIIKFMFTPLISTEARNFPQNCNLPSNHILLLVYFHKVDRLNVLLICNCTYGTCLSLKTKNTGHKT